MTTKQKAISSTQMGIFLMVVHVAGILGMMSSARELFLSLTPVTLVFSFLVLVYYHENKNKGFYFFTSSVVLLGFLIELIGVNTGWPFGVYEYDWAFAPKVCGTPLVIGLNWFVLTYCGTYVLKSVSRFKSLNAILTGLSVTALDVVIEPVAIHSHYWNWEQIHVPWNNYLTWFICISIFSFWLLNLQPSLKNKISNWLYIAQILFFTILCIYYLS